MLRWISKRKNERMRPSPIVPPFLYGAQLWERCALLLTVSHMMNRAPAADPPIDPEGYPDTPKTPKLLVTRSKSTFQWPPDCLWPFLDDKGDSDT